jgi:phage terminase large subunit-like protein
VTALDLPRLRRDQWEIASHPAKTKVLSMGRRWGKTILGGAVALATAARGGKVAWIVPTYKNSRPVWRWAEATVGILKKYGHAAPNRTDRVIEFPTTGGLLGVYTAENADGIRGESFHLVVLDEAARIAEDVWTDAIQPTLADYDGDAILISTPKGKGWFWHEWQRGQMDGTAIKSWTAPSAANPNPNIRRAAMLARERVPERTYQQEWLALFLDDGGEVFRKVRVAAIAKKSEPYSGRFVMGLDWAMSNDFTVITVMDAETRRMVDMDRFNQIDWAVQRGRVKTMADRWKVENIIAEHNSIGGPNIEALQREGLPVVSFETTAVSKPPLIESLALAFERSEIEILNDPVLVGELEAYERTVSPVTGRSRYGAPDGMHDDAVISLALALWGCHEPRISTLRNPWN